MDNKHISERNMKELIEELNNSDWNVRARAILLLKNYKEPEVINALIEKLNDENKNVWLSAANVLKNSNDPRLIYSFIKKIND